VIVIGGRRGSGLRGVGLLVALAAAARVLWTAGGATLAPPPSSSWSGAVRWYESVGPEVATLAVVRLAALAIALWLFLGTSLELVASVIGGPWARRLADLIAPRSLQRLVHGLAGLSLSAGLAVVAPSAGILAELGPGVAVAQQAEDPSPSSGTATMRWLDAPGDLSPAVPEAVPAQPAPIAPLPTAAPVVPADQVVVGPGDSFWSIAADDLADVLGRPPQDSEIATHWRRLVEANRDRLVDPGNPDLLYAGQELVLPGS
jgi:hypothetical protein